MLAHLLATATDDELRWIAARDYGCDADVHFAALQRVVRVQGGKFVEGDAWHPYEVVELCAHVLQPGHEREFALSTLLVIGAVVDGFDGATDLELKFDDRAHDYQALPADLRDAIVAAYEAVALPGTPPLSRPV